MINNTRFPVRFKRDNNNLTVSGNSRQEFYGIAEAGTNESGPVLGAVKECAMKVTGEWQAPSPPSGLGGGGWQPNLVAEVTDEDHNPNLQVAIARQNDNESTLMVTNPGPDGGRTVEIDLGQPVEPFQFNLEELSDVRVTRDGNLGEETIELELNQDVYQIVDGRIFQSE